MGMYTALEVHVKLRRSSLVSAQLASLLFDDEDIEADSLMGRWQSMIHSDGGRSFGPWSRWMELGSEPCPGCDRVNLDGTLHEEHDRSYIMLYVRSSYKGIAHWDFIDWLKPHALGGWVRWNQEGIDREDVHSFGPLGATAAEDELLAEVQSAERKSEDNLHGIHGSHGSLFYERWAEGVKHALTAMRGARPALPSEVISAFIRDRDGVPRALRQVIERYL